MNPKTKQYAHQLRQALASALELHKAGKWGREEIEAAAAQGYLQVFGRQISGRHIWRILDQVFQKAAGTGDFSSLELYLPGRLVRKTAANAFDRYAKDLPRLASAVQSVKDAAALTDGERLLIWDTALLEFQRLIDLGSREGRARRVIISALDASGLPLALTRQALARNFCRKLDRWISSGGTPNAIRDLRKDNPGRAPKFRPTQEDINLLIAHTLAKGDLRRAWREAIAQGLLSGAGAVYLSNPSSKSYVPASVSKLVLPEVELLRPHHLGPRQAKLNGAYITRDWSDTLPGDWYGADDTTLPVYYWEEDEQGVVHVMRGQFLAMIDNRTNRILAFALHSERNYTATVIRGLILRTHDAYGLPRRGFHFENGMWRSAKILKGVQSSGQVIDPGETEIGLREWVEFRHAKPGNARAKPVERVFGLIQDLMEDQPGYCGRDEKAEVFERVQRNKLAVQRGESPQKLFLHRDEWIDRLGRICDEYNNQPQQGKLAGQSPRGAWEALFDYDQPLVKLSPETRYLLANHRALLKVSRNGLAVRLGGKTYWYRNEVTGSLVGREVHVFFNPEDMTSCFVKISPADSAAHVVPLAPAIPATTASPEQLGAAQASVESQNRAARTRYRQIASYFPKNGPSPFRPVVADAATIENGQQIAEDQAAIKASQQAQAAADRKSSRLRRELNADSRVPAERLEIAAQLRRQLEELTNDANTTPGS